MYYLVKKENKMLFEEKTDFAVLIDSENISSQYAKLIFDEMGKYGATPYRRIYGDWAKRSSWNESILLEYSIAPIQQFNYTKGKNAIDIAMVIDAMDLLYRKNVEGFCIISSDSDFTKLAMRLKEENKYVLGMGISNTPQAFVRACSKFVHLDLISDQEICTSEKNIDKTLKETALNIILDDSKIKNESNRDTKEFCAPTDIKKIENAILAIINESDVKAVDLGYIGKRLSDKFSDFDTRHYGYTKLSTFIEKGMSSFKLMPNSKSGYNVQKNTVMDIKVLEKEILQFIEKSKGVVEPLSLINRYLNSKYAYFNLKDCGFSRISSLLKTIEGLTLSDNKVTLTKKKELSKTNKNIDK